MAREFPRNYPSRASVEAKRQTVTFEKRLRDQTVQLAGVNVAGSLGPALIQSVAVQTTGAIREFFFGLEAALKSLSDADMTAIHQGIAEKAQRSVLGAYSRRQPSRDLPAYRAGASNTHKLRYANGALLRAIGAHDFFRVDRQRIEFINKNRLDAEAKHWRRLNFGTRGGTMLRPPAEFRINWGKTSGGGELIAAAFGLDPDVRPAFRIPPGVWLQPGIFFPMGEFPQGQRGNIISFQSTKAGGEARRARAEAGPKRGRKTRVGEWTRGIASTNFLDAGVERIAREVGPAYFRLYDEHFGGSAPSGLANQRVQVRVPTLRARPSAQFATRGRSLSSAYAAGGFTQAPGATYYGSRGGAVAKAVASLFGRSRI